MSVLVKGMEMPKEGKRALWLVIHADGVVEYDTGDYGWQTTKAVSVQPHGRLIDADALNTEIKGPSRPEIYDGMEEVWWIEKCLANAPTIIEAEVEE